METEYYYRYERAFMGDFQPAKINLYKYRVIKRTPKGCWVKDYYKERFIKDGARKRYAYPTPDEAYANFVARTNRCVEILENQLKAAKRYATAEQPQERWNTGELKSYMI